MFILQMYKIVYLINFFVFDKLLFSRINQFEIDKVRFILFYFLVIGIFALLMSTLNTVICIC